ncbi:hypothetical protein P6709_10110 [Jeotgalibacillus sp. ET6]|uniref:hypothetical protein n=1 Tax=Jeotgalibacillus sp. ET6 TaxID=3037260 RepID=UPI002418A7D4|nr:hypothetical protein [Jeotgalibacillus sp. ET6]MDG5472106.1 hypothetical protein [Jeotgalibacillus sp. ET6]
MSFLKYFTLLMLLLLIAGCADTRIYSDDQYSDAEKMTIDFLSKNFQDADNPEIESVEDAEMGGIKVIGAISNAEFTLLIDTTEDGEMSIGALSSDEGFPEKKPECVDKVCK